MVDGDTKLDAKKIPLPNIILTQIAKDQLNLIIKNDFTLAGKYLRILVSGKGCDGFTYSIGFTDLVEEDLVVPVKNDQDLEFILDPFTAFYLQEAQVDYFQDFENNSEGFIVKNLKQNDFSGKFWKKAPEKVPPMKSL